VGPILTPKLTQVDRVIAGPEQIPSAAAKLRRARICLTILPLKSNNGCNRSDVFVRPLTIFHTAIQRSINRITLRCEKPKILIVDDCPDNSATLADILADAGYKCDIAHDGATAFERVRAGQGGRGAFDLCLLDFKLPDIDGAQLFQRMSAGDPDLRAIMITAYAGEDGASRAIAAGAWKVLRKPVDVRTLLRLIDELFDRSGPLAE
jgi:CheY-like chemotaxis protein